MMSKIRVLFLALLMALLGGVSFSSPAFSFPSTQVPDSPTISLKSRTFAPEPGIEPALQNQLQQTDANWHGLIQFTEIPNQAQREELASAGVELLSYIPDNAWMASLPPDLGAVQSLPYVNWVGRLLPEDKVSPAIREGNFASWATNSDETVTIWLDLFDDVSLEEARRLIEGEGGSITAEIAELSRLIADVRPDLVGLLATSDMVQWIDQEPPAKEAHNDGIRETISADPVQIAPYNLSGDGVQAAMWDAGVVDPDHPDFNGRLTLPETPAPATHYHPTHVGGIMGGDGSNSINHGGSANQWRGVAPGVEILSYFWDNSVTDHNDALVNRGGDLSQNSWGNAINDTNCNNYGDYSVVSSNYDGIVTGLFGNKKVPVIFSAGNDRNDDKCGLTGPLQGNPNYVNYANLPPPGGTAKNTIVVGATGSDDDRMTAFSSWGPTDDGRIKPDLVAPGEQLPGNRIYSTWPGGGYFGIAGTSMSAPAVSGSVALMLERYEDVCPLSADPLPSTIKALLTHTAKDMNNDAASWFNQGPDYASGYGRINVKEAIDMLPFHVEDGVNHGQVDSYEIYLYGEQDELKVTLVWDDKAAEPNAATALVNNLDLKLISPSGDEYYPWKLDANDPDAPATRAVNDATNGTDNLNVIEQVVIDRPQRGTWTVEVSGKSVPDGPQAYSLVNTHLYADSTCEGSPATDVWLRDNPGDSGNEPSSGSFWYSPDVWVRNIDDGGTTHQNPEFGQTNYLHVNVRNRGAASADNVRALVYFVGASPQGPIHELAGVGTAINLAPGQTQTVKIPWNNVPGPGHYCFKVFLISPQDPIPTPYPHMRNSNNVTQRNFNVVNQQPNQPLNVALTVANPDDGAMAADLIVGMPGQANFLQNGQVTLDLGPQLFQRWQQAGGEGQGVQALDGNLVQVVERSGAFTGGTNDNFDWSNGTEASEPSTELLQYVNQVKSKPNRHFDESRSNHYVAHTFTNFVETEDRICGATLDVRFKPDAELFEDTANDTIGLMFVGDGGQMLADPWQRYIGNGNAEEGVLDLPWIVGVSGKELRLDLSALPLVDEGERSILEELNEHRFLDVVIEDDTTVDHLYLEVRYCSGLNNIPLAAGAEFPIGMQFNMPPGNGGEDFRVEVLQFAAPQNNLAEQEKELIGGVTYVLNTPTMPDLRQVYYRTAGAADDNQFVELYNPHNEELDLDGFAIAIGQGNQVAAMFQFPGQIGDDRLALAPQGRVLIARDATDDGNDVELAQADWEFHAPSDEFDNANVPNLERVFGTLADAELANGGSVLITTGSDLSAEIDANTVVDGVNYALANQADSLPVDTGAVELAAHAGCPAGESLQRMGADTDSSQSDFQCKVPDLAADLSLTLTPPTYAAPGEQVAYTIEYSNNGPAVADGVTVELNLPEGSTAIGTDSTPTVSCNTSNPLTCTIGTLASGATGTINVELTLPNALLGDELSASATIAQTSTEANTINNEVSGDILIAVVDLSLSVSGSTLDSDQPEARPTDSTTMTYMMVIQNLGQITATSATISDDLPAELTFTRITSDTPVTVIDAGDPLVLEVGPIGPGEIQVISFETTSATVIDYDLTNSVEITTANDWDQSNNAATTTYVHANFATPNVEINPRSLSATQKADETTQERLTIRNMGDRELEWSINPNDNWLSVTSTSGTIASDEEEVLSVTFDSSNLASGTYSGTLTITTNDPYQLNIDVLALMTVTGDETFTTELSTGWNLVSIPVSPSESGISEVLTSIAGKYDVVYAYDGCDTADSWKKYDPNSPPFANNLSQVDTKMGLWIHMTQPATLEVSGITPTFTNISACSGWNLVGYPSLEERPVANTLAPISEDYTVIYGYDAADTADVWKQYDPSAPPFANDLTDLRPGSGYWINTTQDVNLPISNP